jgi:hypothetical protein
LDYATNSAIASTIDDLLISTLAGNLNTNSYVGVPRDLNLAHEIPNLLPFDAQTPNEHNAEK